MKSVRVAPALLVVVIIGVGLLGDAEAWSGNIVSYYRWKTETCRRCICQYSWGCSAWRYFTCTIWTQSYRCKRGYRHNGNQNCNIPICYPNCGNGGLCIAPNECDCRGTATGDFCQTLTCSYERPCYPGNCYDNNKCNCTAGFMPESSSQPNIGCLKMTDDNKPYIGRSTTILSHIRAVDQKLLYYFQLDGTNAGQAYVVWSNQRIFNTLSFEFEAKFQQPEDIPDRPYYVHSMELGMVYGNITVEVIDFQKTSKATYPFPCTGASDQNPVSTVYNCSIQNQDFTTLIEHADTLRVTYLAKGGGNRRIRDTFKLLPYDIFQGVYNSTQIEFKFDFIAPKHCKENGSFTNCTSESSMLQTVKEFTKNPIQLRWQGWGDDPFGSGIWMYYLELHKLVVKDLTMDLTEEHPVGPLLTKEIMSNGNAVHSTSFKPNAPGMYSVLLETRDVSNNSRIARRLVLYDPESEITLNNANSRGLHVASAVKETNYTWQTSTSAAGTSITVEWKDYFYNRLHDKDHLLNAVKPFPVQFQDLDDDGILFAKKFVAPSLDDDDGMRTVEKIDNIHGIVRFQYAKKDIDQTAAPLNSEWENTTLSNTVNFVDVDLKNGQGLKIWVKAFDKMGNTKVASTKVMLDSTPPVTSNITDKHIFLNKESTFYNYSSRVELIAQDAESGVKHIGLNIAIHIPGKPDKTFTTMVPAKTDDAKSYDAPGCFVTSDRTTCFIAHQNVYLDNCWFMVPMKSDLNTSSATVDIVVYNQARLTKTLTFEVDQIAILEGLSTDAGPENVRTDNAKHDGFRVVWDLPKKESCYGRADILLMIVYTNATGGIIIKTHIVSSTDTYFWFGGLEPNSLYALSFSRKLSNGGTTPGIHLEARTGKKPTVEEGINIGVVVGVVVGLVVLFVLVIVIVFILARRGVIHPRERAIVMKRAVTKRYRQTFYAEGGQLHPKQNRTHEKSKGLSNPQYDNRNSELYLYGGADLEGPQVWHLDRNDIVFETLITSGRFANIYKASLTKNFTSKEIVVAKTLKENYNSENEQLMRAKMNFTGSVVGDHPNVLKFIGAVVSDDSMGPFIIYEYCEHGTLKDFLESQRNNLTMELQEQLFRIGLDVAKGMEYLASKSIVHRRLAARNILLTFLNEAKISGFGPQPAEEGDEEDQSKKERIPIKWMAPECMSSTKDATEHSDVWSYAVVLWEIFALGETPYTNIRGRDLPAKIKKGQRLDKPEHCDDVWYGVMKRCWAYEAHQRPCFTDVRNELDSLFVAAPGDDYYYYQR